VGGAELLEVHGLFLGERTSEAGNPDLVRTRFFSLAPTDLTHTYIHQCPFESVNLTSAPCRGAMKCL
jgi:hypothetical protein